MNVKQIVQQIRKELNDKSKSISLEKIEKAKKIFGNETKVLAIKIPEVRKIAEPFAKKIKQENDFEIALKIADELYKSGVFEEATIAESILKKFTKNFDNSTFAKLDSWIDYTKNWANIDMLCGWLITPIILKDKTKIKNIFQWAKSNNHWRRRASAVSLVKTVRKGLYLEDALLLAEKLLSDKDDMVQKGVGWLLKEVGGVSKKQLMQFIKKFKSKMPKLVFRLAIEKLPNNEKEKVKKMGNSKK